VDLHIAPYERVWDNGGWDGDEADVQLLSQAAELLGERTYTSDDAVVQVRFDWLPLIEWRQLDAELSATVDLNADELQRKLPPVTVAVTVVDEREDAKAHDVHSFVELFLHESFVMLNVAVPGSFGGRMRWSWSGLRTGGDVHLDARVFETAAATAVGAEGWPSIEPLPLSYVQAWYDALGIGTQQVAETGPARALFHLLYLARVEEEDTMSMVRLALALEAVFDAEERSIGPRIEAFLGPAHSLHKRLRRFFESRDALVHGTAPVAHPMYDDSLDGRADSPDFDYTEMVDFASRVIVGALQQQVRSFNRPRPVA
jgi:hypothetical protein